MTNPFEILEARLSNIEKLLLDLKHGTKEKESSIEQLLTIEQAAEFLNLAVPTLYTKVHKREIPFMKRSKRLYFSKDELTDYLKAGRKKTVSEITSEAEQYLIKRK